MLMPADPKASYLAHKKAIEHVLQEVMQSGWYIMGPKVKIFEEHFASYLGAMYCLGVASGTDAVHLALRACGVRPGDGVITVSHTAVATVAAIDWIGAKPILVDIDPKTYTIDPQKVEDTIRRMPTGHIKAIVAVHLYGHPSDMMALMDIAKHHEVALVEDCAQAHGATIGRCKVGSIGMCGAFSFYPTKNLGAFGDGGTIATSEPVISERVRLLQQYGWRERYISDEVGYNSRLDELQAAILDFKLSFLDLWNDRRREIAQLYNKGLDGLPLVTPVELLGCHHVYHQYVVRLAKRDVLRQYLAAQKIMTSILYPMPVHQQPGYRERVAIGEGGMVVTDSIANEIISLPIYPELTNEQLEAVIAAIVSFFSVSDF